MVFLSRVLTSNFKQKVKNRSMSRFLTNITIRERYICHATLSRFLPTGGCPVPRARFAHVYCDILFQFRVPFLAIFFCSSGTALVKRLRTARSSTVRASISMSTSSRVWYSCSRPSQFGAGRVSDTSGTGCFV